MQNSQTYLNLKLRIKKFTNFRMWPESHQANLQLRFSLIRISSGRCRPGGTVYVSIVGNKTFEKQLRKENTLPPAMFYTV